jgi:hypothetical protein
MWWCFYFIWKKISLPESSLNSNVARCSLVRYPRNFCFSKYHLKSDSTVSCQLLSWGLRVSAPSTIWTYIFVCSLSCGLKSCLCVFSPRFRISFCKIYRPGRNRRNSVFRKNFGKSRTKLTNQNLNSGTKVERKLQDIGRNSKLWREKHVIRASLMWLFTHDSPVFF